LFTSLILIGDGGQIPDFAEVVGDLAAPEEEGKFFKGAKILNTEYSKADCGNHN
jgi:hypothetical protein